MDQPFAAAIRMRHVEDQLGIHQLPQIIAPAHALFAFDAATIGKRKRLAARLFRVACGIEQVFERRIEQVENQTPAVCQCTMNRAQAGELLFDLNQVQKRAEGNCDELKLGVKTKVAHVALL